ncbi:MAG: hypothetical protein EXR27_15625 [Betaproteobacteria bacterium]|nr:hypothetical protein [Betaproteobacteria bacterium]
MAVWICPHCKESLNILRGSSPAVVCYLCRYPSKFTPAGPAQVGELPVPPLKEPQYKLYEELAVGNLKYRVGPIVQFEQQPELTLVTRYGLVASSGDLSWLQHKQNAVSLLRPFPPQVQPQASGDSLNVMGEKHSLAGIAKLKLIAAEGEFAVLPKPGGLILAGEFTGANSTILREIVPGVAQQNYYAQKPVAAADVQRVADLAAYAAATAAANVGKEDQVAAEPDNDTGSTIKRWLGWAAGVFVLVVVVYACSSDDDDGGGVNSDGSVRSSTHHSSGGSHGGK